MPLELFLDQAGREPKTLTGTSNDAAAGSGHASQEGRDAHDSFTAHHRNFCRAAILEDVKYGHDGGGREVDVAGRPPRLTEHLAQLQINRFEQMVPAALV